MESEEMETFWFFRLRLRRAYDSAYDSDFLILTTLSRDIECEIVYWGIVSQSSDNNSVS